MRNTIRRCQPHLGTFVEIDLAGDRDESELQALANLAFAQFRRIDSAMSFHRSDSELSRINRHALNSNQTVSPAMFEVLGEALLLSSQSNGLFDITVAPRLVGIGALPDHGYNIDNHADWRDIELSRDNVRFHRPLALDLGGIAKGYAVDQAMRVIPADIEACINAGGDLRMRPWRNSHVAVRAPDAERALLVDLAMRNTALASSIGNVGAHLGAIVHPHSGKFNADNCIFSVFADSAMRADGLTKIACLGPDGTALMCSLGAQALCIDRHGRLSELGTDEWPQAMTGT